MKELNGIESKSDYKWMIVIGAAIVMALTMGIASNCFALYTIPVTEGIHISRAAFSRAQSMYFISNTIANVAAGKVAEKYGSVSTIRIAALIMGVAYFSNSFISNPVHFTVISVILGAGMALSATVPVTLLIKDWFGGEIGLPLGIAFMGSGVGGMLFQPFIQTLISRFGWRTTYRIIGFIMLIGLVSVSFLALKEAQDPFYNNYNKQEAAGGRIALITGRSGFWTSLKGSLKKLAFWAMMLLSVILGMGTYASINFTATYMQDSGFDPQYAAFIAGLVLGAMAFGKIAMGKIADRFGIAIMTILGMTGLLLTMLGFVLIKNPMAIIMIFSGSFIGCPMGSIAGALLVKKYLGEANYSFDLSMFVAFGNLGVAIIPYISGEIYRATGSYLKLFQIMLGLMFLALILLMLSDSIIVMKERESAA